MAEETVELTESQKKRQKQIEKSRAATDEKEG